MSEPIVYIDKSEILEGKLEEVHAAVKELVAFVEAREPQLLSYNFFISEDGTRMTVVAIHPDSASMEYHMEVAGPAFRRFKDFINLSSIEVYGQVSDKVMTQLQQKARTLGSGTVVVQKPYAGFSRHGAR